MKSEILVVGSINMDVVARVERHPAPGETLAGERVSFLPGGKGANQAVAAQRAGASVSLLGCLGADAFGNDLAAYLADSGVGTSCIKKVTHAATGTALILVDAAAQNSIVVIPGANALLSVADVSDTDFSGIKVCIAQFETPMETVIAAFQKAKKNGALTILNPSPSKIVPQDLMNCTDVLVVNETELAHQAGLNNLPAGGIDSVTAAAQKVRSNRDVRIVATLGHEGLVYLDSQGVHRMPGRKVTAVDTTGAGDCFTGVLAAKLASGLPISDALSFANIAASLSVQKHGAAPSMPTYDDILRESAIQAA